MTLLVQRDLPAWGMPAKPQVTLRMLQMLAALQGQMWNASQIGQSLGLSYHSVNTYMDFGPGGQVTVTGGACVNVKLMLALQPFASVTVTP